MFREISPITWKDSTNPEKHIANIVEEDTCNFKIVGNNSKILDGLYLLV